MDRRARWAGIVAGVAWLAAPAGPARASTVEARTLAELTREATHVVVATVLECRAEWAVGRILTRCRAQIDRVAKGPTRAGEVVEIVTPGGAIAGVGMRVEGAARLPVGETLLVFLTPTPQGLSVAGMAQGCMRVVVGPGGATVLEDANALHLVRRPAPGAPLAPAVGPLAAPRALEDVLHEIEGYARAP